MGGERVCCVPPSHVACCASKTPRTEYADVFFFFSCTAVLNVLVGKDLDYACIHTAVCT